MQTSTSMLYLCFRLTLLTQNINEDIHYVHRVLHSVGLALIVRNSLEFYKPSGYCFPQLIFPSYDSPQTLQIFVPLHFTQNFLRSLSSRNETHTLWCMLYPFHCGNGTCDANLTKWPWVFFVCFKTRNFLPKTRFWGKVSEQTVTNLSKPFKTHFRNGFIYLLYGQFVQKPHIFRDTYRSLKGKIS